jgi:hypothetical protein
MGIIRVFDATIQYVTKIIRFRATQNVYLIIIGIVASNTDI